MAYIMQCPSERLTADLMNDFARCVANCQMDTLEMVYFLGQCGHESAGLRYPMEIHDGSNYEGRSDLGNTQPGDGVKFAGQGYIQVTGRANTQDFSDYMDSLGQGDPNIMAVGKTWNAEKYPWSISGNWWRNNNMKALCAQHKTCNNSDIDIIGARVNGRNRPNGADDRIAIHRPRIQNADRGLMPLTQKSIFNREQARKDNKKAPPKRQRPKAKSGMQVLMNLVTPKPH